MGKKAALPKESKYKPFEKLCNEIGKVLGANFSDPKKMREIADAKSYARIKRAESKKITQHIKNTPLNIDSLPVNIQPLFERAKTRTIIELIEKQENVESIIAAAATNLPGQVDDKPLDSQWRRDFFDYAESISDEEMQQLWGKILAGEIAKQGSYKKRTLQILKTLDKNEAETFVKFASLCFSNGIVYIDTLQPNFGLDKFNIKYSDIVLLRDANLIHESNVAWGIDSDKEEFSCHNWKIIITKKNYLNQIPIQNDISFDAIILSHAGKDLLKLIDNATVNIEYLKTVRKHFTQWPLCEVILLDPNNTIIE